MVDSRHVPCVLFFCPPKKNCVFFPVKISMIHPGFFQRKVTAPKALKLGLRRGVNVGKVGKELDGTMIEKPSVKGKIHNLIIHVLYKSEITYTLLYIISSLLYM